MVRAQLLMQRTGGSDHAFLIGHRVRLSLVATLGTTLLAPPGEPMSQPVYALNLFDVSNKDEYMAYSRRSAREVQAHGGRVIALGKFRACAAGSIRTETRCWSPDARRA